VIDAAPFSSTRSDHAFGALLIVAALLRPLIVRRA
jgi:hypothetical protein